MVKVCAINTKNECGKSNSDSEAEIARGNESEHQLKIKIKSQSNESNSWCLKAKINIKKAMQPRTKWLPSTRSAL